MSSFQARSNSQAGQKGAPPPEPSGLRDISRVLLRRRNVIAIAVGAGLLIGLLAVLLTPRLYQAEATLQVLKQSPGRALPTSASTGDAPVDALDFNLTLQTQVSVLKSAEIALTVIQELGLERADPGYHYTSRTHPLAADEMNVPLTASPRRQANALRVFGKRLQVDLVGGTRLIVVKYEDPDPVRAAQVVNQVLKDFIGYNAGVRSQANSQAMAGLHDQLRGIKTDVEDARGRVATLQKSSGIYGSDPAHNVITARMEQLNTGLVTAESTLVIKQAIARAADTGDPELVAGLVNTGGGGGGANPTLAVLQSLRQQQSEAQAALSSLTAKFGPNYPRVVEARERAASLDRGVSAETANMRARADTEYRVALRVRDDARRALEQQKQEDTTMTGRAVDYSMAKSDADSKEALYEQLTAKLTEAEAFASLPTSEISVVDKAAVPDRASKPAVLLYLAAAILGGLLLGIVLAFVLDLLDGTVKSPDEVERSTGGALLALIPLGEKTPALDMPSSNTSDDRASGFYHAVLADPRSRIGESFRQLRSNLLVGVDPRRRQVIAVTSASSGEGKGFTTLNLASSFAQMGRKVLIVDADSRKGKLTHFLGQQQVSDGFAEFLRGGRVFLLWKNLMNMAFIPRRLGTPEQDETFGTMELAAVLSKARSQYDVILVDTPPLLPVVDALAVAKLADITLVVLRFGRTSKTALQQVQRLLTQSDPGGEVAYVLNAMNPTGPDYRERVGTGEYAYVSH